jgi:hypothetical protein
MEVFDRVALRGQLREFKRKKATFEQKMVREEDLFKDLFAQMLATPIVGPPPTPTVPSGPSETALLSSSQRDAFASSTMYFDSRKDVLSHPSSHVPPLHPSHPSPLSRTLQGKMSPKARYSETWKERDEKHGLGSGKMEYVTGGMAQMGYTYKKGASSSLHIRLVYQLIVYCCCWWC